MIAWRAPRLRARRDRQRGPAPSRAGTRGVGTRVSATTFGDVPGRPRRPRHARPPATLGPVQAVQLAAQMLVTAVDDRDDYDAHGTSLRPPPRGPRRRPERIRGRPTTVPARPAARDGVVEQRAPTRARVRESATATSPSRRARRQWRAARRTGRCCGTTTAGARGGRDVGDRAEAGVGDHHLRRATAAATGRGTTPVRRARVHVQPGASRHSAGPIRRGHRERRRAGPPLRRGCVGRRSARSHR